MPKISVIIPAYNSALFIRQTIASITAQSVEDFEIIVVDDGSIDATAEIASTLDGRVRVVRQGNQGIAGARNAGLSHARGELIAFMDHDDLWHPNKLQAQIQVLERDPGCGIVYSEFLRWDPRTSPVFPDEEVDSNRIAPELSGFILSKLVHVNWVLLSTAVVRREVFDVVGKFDTAMPPGDDWDFMLRASEHFRFIKLAQPLALYRVHAGQTSLKLTERNVEFEIRSRALDRLKVVGGEVVDVRDVQLRQYRAIFNYGLAQYSAGLYRDAHSTFFDAICYRPRAGKAALYWAASWMKSLLNNR